MSNMKVIVNQTDIEDTVPELEMQLLNAKLKKTLEMNNLIGAASITNAVKRCAMLMTQLTCH